MPEHEAAGLSAMRGSGARGDPNRAYRRYTAIPLIDYAMKRGFRSLLHSRRSLPPHGLSTRP